MGNIPNSSIWVFLKTSKKRYIRDFLVVQWLRIHLPVEGQCSTPGLERSHYLRQLSPSAITTEAVTHNQRVCNATKDPAWIIPLKPHTQGQGLGGRLLPTSLWKPLFLLHCLAGYTDNRLVKPRICKRAVW